MTHTARARTAWQTIYSDPVQVKAGEALAVEDRDSEWPGWVWCTHPDGRTGWVPLAWLDREGSRAVARRDYAATELAVEPGEELELLEYESGWHWARNAAGHLGWVPAANLELC